MIESVLYPVLLSQLNVPNLIDLYDDIDVSRQNEQSAHQ